jgi:signal transduction histidine kinase
MMYSNASRRLFWRLYLYGLAVIFFVEVALFSFGSLYIGPRFKERTQRSVDYLASDLASAEEFASIDARLRDLHQRIGADFSVYNADKTLRATTIDPPIPFPVEEWFRIPFVDPPPSFLSELRDQGVLRGYLVTCSPAMNDVSYGLAALELLLMLFAAALCFLIARSLARPLEQLSDAARRLGEGDLDARAPRSKRVDELGDLTRAFNDMADHLSQQLLAEKEMLANISHELRTPLARIRVVLDLAGEEETSGPLRRYLSEIVRDLGEIDRLVEDVLCAARLDLTARRAGSGTPLRPQTVSAARLVGAARARLESAHPKRALRCEVAPSLPEFLGDPSLLRRALDNLLDNAHKYSPPDTTITLSARLGEGGVVFDVQDQGPGIDADDLPRLFEPFFRADRSRNRSTGGLGLGLALVKRILDAHRGRVEISSHPGAGTTARLWLPLPEVERLAA